MTKPFNILTPKEQDFHNNPPSFDATQRKRIFYLSRELKRLLKDIRGSNNKVFFLLSFAYFKETAQFYSNANQRDVNYICGLLGSNKKNLDITLYTRHSRTAHQKIILDFFNAKPFDKRGAGKVTTFVKRIVRSRQTPRQAFYETIEFLKTEGFEIPEYLKLAKLISSVYNDTHQTYLTIVKDKITKEGKNKLDSLVERSVDYPGNTQYKLTHTKRFSHSLKLSKIKENIARHSDLLDIFLSIKNVFKALNLTTKEIRSFASTIEYSDVVNTKRRKDYNKYLYLAVFTANQLFRIQDILTKSHINIMKSAFNEAEKNAKNQYFEMQEQREESINLLTNTTDSILVQLKTLTRTLENPSLTDSEKVKKALRYIEKERVSSKKVEDDIKNINSALEKTTAFSIYIENLKNASKSLRNKCKPIILSLTFDYTCSDKNLTSVCPETRLLRFF